MKAKLILGLALNLSVVCPAAIVYPRGPDGGKQAAAKYLDSDLLKGLRITHVESLTIADPLPWYATGDLGAGKLLAPGQPVRWAYPLRDGAKVVGEVALNATNKFISVGTAPFEYEALEAARRAEAWPEVKGRDYEFRLLSDMSVSFSAVWLHGTSNDFIIPLPPTYGRLTAYQPYSESQIIDILQPVARRNQAMWDKLLRQQRHDWDAYARAMTDYEQSHGGQCGAIAYYGMCAPFEKPAPLVQVFTLWGKSSECGHLAYKARVTYEHEYDGVRTVEILGKTDFKEP